MKKPSLALIPSGYKASKIYSILPNNGDGDFAFSRGSGATRVNKDGFIETVLDNVPRLDYSDGGCPSLLLEPQRTNLVPYSEDFSNAAWAKGNVDISTADIVSPSGELNATKMTSTGTGTIRIFDAVSTSSGLDYAVSLYIKQGNTDFIFFRTSSGALSADFNLTTLTATNGSIEDVGNGWYRIIAIFNASSTTEVLQILLLGSSPIGSFQYIYGAQVEQSDYATSYIPTNGSAVTRSKDRCTDSGNADIFNDDRGVLYLETKGLSTALNGYVTLFDGAIGTYTNHIIFQYRTDGDLRVYVGGLTGSNINFLISNIDLSENHKIAFQYQSLTDNKLFIDGVEQTKYVPFTPTTLSGLNRFDFTINNNNSLAWEGKVNDLRYFDETLTDAELIELTTL